MAKIDISTFKVNRVQEYFIDTSVWLLLYGNLGNYNNTDQKFYSRIFSEIVQKDAGVVLTSTVLSEMANVLLKKAFKDFALLQNCDISNLKFKKDFVGTAQYLTATSFIKTIFDSILNMSNVIRLSDSFGNIEMNNVMKSFEAIDFNDSYYLELLRMRNQKTIIVTNDSDFNLVATSLMIYTNK